MQSTSRVVLATTVVFAALWAVPSLAQDLSAGKSVGSVESTRSAGGAEFSAPDPTPVPSIAPDFSAGRDVVLDPEAAARAFTLVGRSRTGEEVRIEPGENVIRAIEGETPEGEDQRGSVADDAPDPAFAEDAEEEGERAVIGSDDRIRVARTTTYPFTTIGYLSMQDAAGEFFGCSGALIGPRTVLTAASCLYSHDKGGWFDNFAFYPGINGANDVPYAASTYDTAYVLDAYITNYDGSHDAIWAYDIGIVTLADAPGEQLGWLGYWHYADLGDFQGNLVGYHFDKPAHTMWRSTCNVLAEDIYEMYFVHTCDAGFGSAGAPVYVFDQNARARVVVGVNIGQYSGSGNWALRLYRPVFEWLQSVNQ